MAWLGCLAFMNLIWDKKAWKRPKKVVRPAFGCVQHPKAGQNTQHSCLWRTPTTFFFASSSVLLWIFWVCFSFSCRCSSPFYFSSILSIFSFWVFRVFVIRSNKKKKCKKNIFGAIKLVLSTCYTQLQSHENTSRFAFCGPASCFYIVKSNCICLCLCIHMVWN